MVHLQFVIITHIYLNSENLTYERAGNRHACAAGGRVCAARGRRARNTTGDGEDRTTAEDGEDHTTAAPNPTFFPNFGDRGHTTPLFPKSGA